MKGVKNKRLSAIHLAQTTSHLPTQRGRGVAFFLFVGGGCEGLCEQGDFTFHSLRSIQLVCIPCHRGCSGS